MTSLYSHDMILVLFSGLSTSITRINIESLEIEASLGCRHRALEPLTVWEKQLITMYQFIYFIARLSGHDLYIIELYSFVYHLTYVRTNFGVNTVGIHPANF